MPELKFNEEAHIYTLDNHVIPSVTQIMKAEGLVDYFNSDPWYMERGQAVHKATHLLDLNELDWETVDSRIMGYLEAYMKFKRETGWIFEHREKALHHPIYNYCGTPDAWLPLVDIKTGQESNLQLAAYWELLRANGYNPPREAYSLKLNEDGTYKLSAAKDIRQNVGIFLAAVTVHNYKRGRK